MLHHPGSSGFTSFLRTKEEILYKIGLFQAVVHMKNIGWGTETMVELVTDFWIETVIDGSDHCSLILKFKE